MVPSPGEGQLTLAQFEQERPFTEADRPSRSDPLPPGPTSDWEESAEKFVQQLRKEGTVGAEWTRRIRWHILRTPSLLRRLGFHELRGPQDLGAEHVQAIRDRLGWERNSLLVYFAAIRPFLRFLRLPLADSKGVWKLPSGEATHRRWLRGDQLSQLFQASRGAERLVVALEGFNGLRRVEILRLRMKDVDLGKGVLRVCGKGKGGGKWRTIPLTSIARAELEDWVRATRPTDLLLPRSASWVDHCLDTATKRAQLSTKVSNHDLRRTFGRLAHQSGMGLVDLKNVMGHQSVDMTTRYIGLDEDHMREGLTRFEERMVEVTAPTPNQGGVKAPDKTARMAPRSS